ncbi:hypothetical protein EDD18DRAFT_1072294 [Armillaria luteobubalina]|uniref:CxC2-like cysteine cluster KDZ transposase-associated domain-containing protein n=1 Tax=Armillaria luteobubalina TaxID=153913 RepID=A0AA39Q7M7_9AGAR|nr:hypothetical protein EDD18DRAFT_1072598 [Armillaria luteobubalina]KAK0497786.1 hypothetical protein EDD18DRAFT_1072294 [Armillaria luteobubalina]
MDNYRQETLDEFIRLEGRGDSDAQEFCLSCRSESPWPPLFRCRDCLGTSLECGECTVAKHRDNPFHVLECWNRSFFVKVFLRELGLRIQLGHHWMSPCVNPRPGPCDFTVLHVNGIHNVCVDFCWCDHRVVPWKQLLRAELFPATVDQPKTCASFRLLEQFHALSGSGKISVYEYHNALKHLTDATGVSKLKCKYKSLLRLVRQFAHMKFTKRARRGSVPNGIETTIAGGLALRYLACPHPGINLPADWDLAPLEYQFLYMLILALDANFRLKNLYRSSWEKDPGLHMGLAHFVEPTRYLEHVRQYATQKDISSCSGFKTLSHAETKSAVGLRATGVGMVVCACHEVIRPLAIADLQRGERYCNMDYIALSALKDSTAEEYQVKTVFFSYDIVCQWKKKFRERMATFPPEMHIPSRIDLQYSVPKCHCKGHKLRCQCSFSMNIHTVGRTDGEGIERCWAEINVMANSTKEMGPGNRYDTLDVQFAWHNWKKIVGLGKSLVRRHVKARHKSSRHVGAFLALSEVLPDSSLKQDWTAEIEAWERDNSLPSPYFIDMKHLSEAQVVLTLKEEECQAALSDGVDIEDSSAMACIEVALTVEDLQRRIRQDLQDEKDEVSVGAAKDIQKKWIILQKHMLQLRNLQAEYMPCVKAKLRQTVLEYREIEHQMLWLPSELDRMLWEKGCFLGVVVIEATLREAQCRDALSSLCSTLRARHSLFSKRNKNFQGQKQNTRVADTARRLDKQCRLAGAKYKAARAALKTLRGAGPWEDELRELHVSDMSSLHGSVLEIDNEDDLEGSVSGSCSNRTRREVGEGHREISWIWLQEGALGDSSDEGLTQAVKLEWLKSRARAHRWREECLLLTEEKRRVRETLLHTAHLWDSRGSSWEELEPSQVEGVRAHAARQAAVFRSVSEHFRVLWNLPEEEVVAMNDDEDSEADPDECRANNVVEQHV